MANETTVNLNVAYSDAAGTELSLGLVNFKMSPGTKRAVQITQTIPTSETAVNLGGISSPGVAVIINRDATNYVEVKVATSGAIFAKLLPGMGCLVPLGSGATAPYAIANSASCEIETLIISN